MKTFAIALAALLLAGTFFAVYVENIEVRVLDQLGRVVPGAAVYATYEISKSKGHFTTKTKLTNGRGRVNLSLYNVEYLDSETNKDYVINAQFGDKATSTGFTAGVGEYPRTVQVEAYYVGIRTQDKDGRPISATIGLFGQEKQTDSGGGAYFLLPPGEHELATSYRGISRASKIFVSGDSTFNVSVILYNFTVMAIDDDGQPLAADFYVGPVQKKGDGNGSAFFENIIDPQPQIAAYFGRFKKIVQADLAGKSEVSVVFDTHPPKISGVQAEWKGKFLQVRATVEDVGKYASGLAKGNASIKLLYITLNGTEREVPMYAIGYNLYEGLIPGTGVEKQIRYSIRAIDAEGNAKTSQDTFVLPTNLNEPPSQGQQQPPLGSLGQTFQETNILPQAAAFVAIVLIIFIAYHYRNKLPIIGRGGLEPPAPPSPPEPPKKK